MQAYKRAVHVLSLVMAVAVAACSSPDSKNTSLTQPPPAAANAGQATPIERVPVVASKGADNKCQWAAVAMEPTRRLVEKFTGHPGIGIRLDRNETTCVGSVDAIPVDLSKLRPGPIKMWYPPKDTTKISAATTANGEKPAFGFG
jgi:hypothetical protein